MDNSQYIFQSPGPILLDLNFIQLRWYGLMYAVAFLACYFTLKRITRNREFKLSDEALSNLLYTVLIFGIIGARLWYVALSWEYYSTKPLEILQIWHGGQAIQGGILGSMLGVYFFQKENLVEKLGLVAVVAPLGQAIGRWGNFFNEEAFGRVTDLPWKLYISHTDSFHHPTFLYESLWNLFCFGILLRLFSKQAKPATLLGSYLFLYSLGRFFIEPMRTDNLLFYGFPAAVAMAILGMIVGSLVIIASNDRKH